MERQTGKTQKAEKLRMQRIRLVSMLLLHKSKKKQAQGPEEQQKRGS